MIQAVVYLNMIRWSVIILILVLTGCNTLKSVKNALRDTPPYEQYIVSLEKADLHRTHMVSAWLDAGKKVFHDSIIVNLPFIETGFFQGSEPAARAYRFNVKDGQVLTVEGMVKTTASAKLFVDLFIWKDNKWNHLVYADSTLALSHEFNKDYHCLLRIQPELLINAYYSVSIALTPILINPVSGASNKSIGSFYGDQRDGGRRKHEGVDIFAPRGTPVVAPTNGYVSRVGTGTLGGKVIWMNDTQRGHSYYFAHLDSQLVKPGMRVKQGEVIALVGNTGNAKTTPPHLHFGIYQVKSKDPLNYIRTMERLVERLPIDTTFQSLDYKVTAKTAGLYAGPGEKHLQVDKLVKDTYVKVIGQSETWVRVELPTKRQGYVVKRSVTPAATGKPLKITGSAIVLSEANQDAIPIAYVDDSHTVEVFAVFKNWDYVKTQEGLFGWLMR